MYVYIYYKYTVYHVCMHMYICICIYIYIATHWNLECDFGNGALQKKRRKMPKSGVLHFFAPFFQSRHLSNGDLRMRAHRIVYHIIVLLSWFWVGIVRSPRSSNVNLECRHLSCDFHQQRMLFFKFYLHFGHILHFFGMLILVRFHRSIEIWPHLCLIRRFYFHHGLACFDWVFSGGCVLVM